MEKFAISQWACNFIFLALVLWFCDLLSAIWKDKKAESLKELQGCGDVLIDDFNVEV